jgi:hypothetical protein
MPFKTLERAKTGESEEIDVGSENQVKEHATG